MRGARKRVLLFAFAIILVLGLIIGGLRILESTVFYQEPEELPVTSKTITRNGTKYYPRQDITVVMVLGIDETGPVVSSGSYRNTGEADAVILLVLDETNETYTILSLNRDTMLKMPVLGLGGKQAGTFYGQLALAHTYGEGLEDSCENTRNTVSDLLYGINIDYYVSMNMDAIAIINDAVGGVTVNVTDDFSQVDPSITMGEMKLTGEQALRYVQSRMAVGSQLNISRMGRHEEYIQSLMKAVTDRQEERDMFYVELYEDISPYMVSDCSSTVINNLMNRCSDYTMADVITPAGENVLGKEYYEFHLDEGKLDELILHLFYSPK